LFVEVCWFGVIISEKLANSIVEPGVCYIRAYAGWNDIFRVPSEEKSNVINSDGSTGYLRIERKISDNNWDYINKESSTPVYGDGLFSIGGLKQGI
jgi:hypothetical protein